MIPSEKEFHGRGFRVFARSDLAVVDHNSECADMDNPRGEIYGELWYVVIENGKGRRWACRANLSTEDQALTKASIIADMLADEARLNPENWQEIDPCYGSEAYEAQGIEAQRAYEDQNPDDSRYSPGRWY